MVIWTVAKLMAAAKANPLLEVRPVSQMSDIPCNINRMTKGGKRREGVVIYEDRTIHRNDVEPHRRLRMRPQDAARVLGLE